MSHEYHATIHWAGNGAAFTDGKYSRAHTWSFDGGIELAASSSPLVVPAPLSRLDAVDPEEAFVASLSSCHMLTFLHLACKKRIRIVDYADEASGFVERTPEGKFWVSRVVLRPRAAYDGTPPAAEEVSALHHAAHEACFIANSVKSEVVVEPV